MQYGDCLRDRFGNCHILIFQSTPHKMYIQKNVDSLSAWEHTLNSPERTIKIRSKLCCIWQNCNSATQIIWNQFFLNSSNSSIHHIWGSNNMSSCNKKNKHSTHIKSSLKHYGSWWQVCKSYLIMFENLVYHQTTNLHLHRIMQYLIFFPNFLNYW